MSRRLPVSRRLPDVPAPAPGPAPPHARADPDANAAGTNAAVAPSPIAAVVAAHEARLDGWAATLHDEVLQPLYALRLADAHLSPDARAERLGTIAASVHRLIASLAPPVLADFGLASALHALAPTAVVRLGGTDEADLPAPTARYLFRIAQEALEPAAPAPAPAFPVTAPAVTAPAVTAPMTPLPTVRLDVSRSAATLAVDGRDGGALPLVRAVSYAHAAGGTLVVGETSDGPGYRVRVPLPGTG